MANETNSLNEISRSVSQWYSQMSFAHVNVPRFNSCANVHDFLAEYDDATITLTDEQKVSLLNRAFPPGCHRSWYDNELKPLIMDSKPWGTIRKKILDRFSMQEDRDRHLAKLRELKFAPDGNKMLLDFVDDLIYSYRKAYPNEKSNEPCIRWIKSALPQTVHAALMANPNYQDNTDIEKLKEVVKQYDMTRAASIGTPADHRATTEMVSMMKNLVTSIRTELEQSKKDNEATRKDNEATRGAIVAAFQPYQAGYRNRSRSRSPRAFKQDSRQTSGEGRPLSPRPQMASSNPNWHQDVKPTSQVADSVVKQDQQPPKGSEQIYNPIGYFNKFGIPPGPCPECKDGSWHWMRHCYNRLN
jgi:hypothetical protein